MRPAALRLRVPEESDTAGTISFIDRVYGAHTEVLARDCGDFLVQRSDGVFAYQLVVVVDDAEMGVTEVVRGRDLIGSTARQIWLQKELGLPSPVYGHIPLLTDADGRRLSKRDGDLDLQKLRQRWRPEEIIGMLAAAAGLLPSYRPAAAAELVPGFSWEKVRREDIRLPGWIR